MLKQGLQKPQNIICVNIKKVKNYVSKALEPADRVFFRGGIQPLWQQH